MNPKERVIAQIEHHETDFLPYYLIFDDESEIEIKLDAYFGTEEWRLQLDNAIHVLPMPSEELVIELGGKASWTDLYGSTWRCDVRPFHLSSPTLREPSLEGYQFPTMEECFENGWEEQVRKLISEEKDYFLLLRFGFGLFERSWALRGFNNVLMDVIINRTFYEELLDRITEHQLQIIDRLVTFDVDGIYFSDDWGYQDGILIGPERWREMIKPRVAMMYQRVHDAGKYVLTHCCGSIAEIIPDVIEIGLDVYESVQPEARNNNPYELKQKFGGDLTFWGGLGSQSILPLGTPKEIRVEVERLCSEMGRGGGYILAPAKAIQPETPIENAAATVEAFLEQAGETITS
ncbi:MAG: hypothetical protein GTO18_09890 [Anaerolineales bacterium]|nr:hypothetical protein [Anaerolineales bacterium]